MSATLAPPPDHESSAVAFLRQYGHMSLVSLGCGCQLNRIDNHLRLMAALHLTFYVGIDQVPDIKLSSTDIFLDRQCAEKMWAEYDQTAPQGLWQAIKVFPNTWVEELRDLHCAAIVCQRVEPYCRWEEVMGSMRPKLILQEDLHGCERQQLRGHGYVRTWIKVQQYGLQPFRPWPIFPGERNLILWRHRDFDDEEIRGSKWKVLWCLRERFIG
jgi:hypothetical protein